MKRMTDLAQLRSGSPQFRIHELEDEDAPAYPLYGQAELEADLAGAAAGTVGARLVRTYDDVLTLKTGDLVFSLISGKAALVGPAHSGCLFTQNYVRVLPSPSVDAAYLAYLLNEDTAVRRQLFVGQQGSKLLKYTVRQLADLRFSDPPPPDIQRTVGSLYLNQLKLEALKKRRATLETTLVTARIKEALQS